MHNLNRILTMLVMMALVIPPATFAVLSLDEKNVAQENLDVAIGTAVTRYQQRSGLQGLKSRGERQMMEEEQKLLPLVERKAKLRTTIAKYKRIIKTIEEKHDIVISSKDEAALLIASAKTRFSHMLKAGYLQRVGDTSSAACDIVLKTILHGAAPAGSMRVSASQIEYLEDLVAAEKVFWRLETLELEREKALQEYWEAQRAYDKAEALVQRSDAQLNEIKRIMAEVHGQVLRLQSELARIDARIKAKAERTLIEKGLLDPKVAGAKGVIAYTPQFSWPLYGAISAGFLNAKYKERFGVPHYGLDIVAGENTPVASAADGVVFLVRDGGQTGYTYVLIGHRGGYATLYGHLLSTAVTAGQDISAGQIIGMSGGRPGTPGAGPMTTGPHLHLEVIKAGVNVDPRSVLP